MKTHAKTLLAAVTTAAITGVSAQAAVVFSDDFESPDVAATYNIAQTSKTEDASKWVGSNQGFNSSRSGIVDEAEDSGNSFTDPTGSQAWAGRYSSNTGVTSAEGVIGAVAAGQTITVSFNAVTDGYNGGDDINAYLVLYADGASGRDTFNSGVATGATVILKKLTQNDVTTSAYQAFSFSYTVGDDVDGGASWDNAWLGQDLAIRFEHKNDAIVDDVEVDLVVPEPGSLALIGVGGLMMLRRRRN